MADQNSKARMVFSLSHAAALAAGFFMGAGLVAGGMVSFGLIMGLLRFVGWIAGAQG